MRNYIANILIIALIGTFTSGCTTLEFSDVEFKSIAGIQRRDTTMSALPELNFPDKGTEPQIVVEFESSKLKNSLVWRPYVFKCGELKRQFAMTLDSSIHTISDKTYRFYFKESYAAHDVEGTSKPDPHNLCFRLQKDSGILTIGVSNIVKVPNEKASEAFRSHAP